MWESGATKNKCVAPVFCGACALEYSFWVRPMAGCQWAPADVRAAWQQGGGSRGTLLERRGATVATRLREGFATRGASM